MTQSRVVRSCLAGLGGVAFLVGSLFLARFASERRFLAVLGPLEPGAYTRPPVKSGTNAARYFLAACGKLRVEPEQAQMLANWEVGEPTPQLVALAQQNQASLRLAMQAASLKESFYGLDYSSGFATSFPELPRLVALGRLLALEALVAESRGETGRAVAALGALGRLAASLEREPGLSPFTAGLLLERCQLIAVTKVFCDPSFPRKRAAELLQTLSQEPLLQGFTRVVGLEEASLRQALVASQDWTTFLADAWVRWRSSERALSLAGLVAKPTTSWCRRLQHGRVENQSFRLLATLAQAQGVTTSRVLVATGLTLALHAGDHGELPKNLGLYPEATKPTCFTGELMEFMENSACLHVPGGRELWQKLQLPQPPAPFSLCLSGF
ncbi:MAG: hypothetical protein ACUVRQ_01970 [Thermoanaerobaculaceae bacterium]